DVVEDGFPNVSWRDKLVRNVEERGLEDEIVVESKLDIGEDDYTISTEDKYPKITFSKRIHEWIDRSMAKTVVVVNLDNNFFMVKIGNQKDYDNALMGGPWMIYGHFLVVQPWSRDFITSESYPSKMVVWVRELFETIREWEIGRLDRSNDNVNYRYYDATTTGAAKDSISLYKPWMQVPTHRRKPNILGNSTIKGKQDQPSGDEMVIHALRNCPKARGVLVAGGFDNRLLTKENNAIFWGKEEDVPVIWERAHKLNDDFQIHNFSIMLILPRNRTGLGIILRDSDDFVLCGRVIFIDKAANS
ncbi:hypothetical protein Goshw_026739, partial [Gossypium schwendimanii]|nr:hypothetical protein [Gossypium schwendimanii]